MRALLSFQSQKSKMAAKDDGQYSLHANNVIITTLQPSKHPHFRSECIINAYNVFLWNTRLLYKHGKCLT